MTFLNLIYNIEKWLFIILFLLLPMIDIGVLMDSNRSEKFFFFYLILIFILCFRFIVFFCYKRIQRINITLFDILGSIYILYIFINRIIINDNIHHSVYLFETIGLCIIYLLLRSSNSNNNLFLLWIIIVSGLIQFFYAVLQITEVLPSNHGVFKFTGGFSNPGPFSGYLVSILPIAFTFYLYRKELRMIIKNKVSKSIKQSTCFFNYSKFNVFLIYELPLAAVLLIIIILPSTQSRAAWIAGFISLCLLLNRKFSFLKYLGIKFRNVYNHILSFFVIAIILYGLYSINKDSSNGRILIWKNTFKMFIDNPLTGLGYENFKTYYMDYQAEFFKKDPYSKFAQLAADNNYVYNDIARIGSETGLIGLILAITPLFLVLTSGIKKQTTMSIVRTQAAKHGIIAILIFGFFSYPSSVLPIKLNFILLCAICSENTRNIKINKSIKHFNGLFFIDKFKLIYLGIVLTLLLNIFLFMTRWCLGYKVWADAYNYFRIGDYHISLNYYHKSYPMLKNNGTFLLTFGKCLHYNKKYNDAINILNRAKTHLSSSVIYTTLGDSYQAIGQYVEAEKCYLEAHYMIPNRFYPKYLLAKLYDKTNKKSKALKTAMELINKKIKVPSSAIEEILYEMQEMIRKYDVDVKN